LAGVGGSATTIELKMAIEAVVTYGKVQGWFREGSGKAQAIEAMVTLPAKSPPCSDLSKAPPSKKARRIVE
jgi:hypothetical protein